MLTSRPWFVARRRFGWGWSPATWEGWTATAAYAAIVLGLSVFAGRGAVLIPVLVATGVLLCIIVLTGTRPGGRLF